MGVRHSTRDSGGELRAMPRGASDLSFRSMEHVFGPLLLGCGVGTRRTKRCLSVGNSVS